LAFRRKAVYQARGIALAGRQNAAPFSDRQGIS
jgi:hypothetical protein